MKAAEITRQELEQEVNKLQYQITEDNGKLAALAELLRIAEPQLDAEENNLATYQDTVYWVSMIMTDYTDRISSALSDLEFITR